MELDSKVILLPINAGGEKEKKGKEVPSSQKIEAVRHLEVYRKLGPEHAGGGGGVQREAAEERVWGARS